jgi:hypothetical protein
MYIAHAQQFQNIENENPHGCLSQHFALASRGATTARIRGHIKD